MLESKETHNRIIQTLERRGPSLPIQIAKDLGINSLFISAFLSELVDTKRIKTSSLRVGGSSLYLLEGQEPQLENFSHNLNPMELEALSLLKKHKILRDSELEPAIRVAIRSIRDFAQGFKHNEEILWKHTSTNDEEIKELLQPKPKKIPNIKKIIKSTKSIKMQTPQKSTVTFTNPLVKEEKPRKEKPKSEFSEKIINTLSKKGFQIIEEQEHKAKEFNCLIEINSDLGPIRFLTQAKDKKTISETDINKLLSQAQSIPLPALLIYTGKLSKKAEELTKTYYSILKTKKVV